ncbi:MAG TPA: hypothetical protein VJY34_10450 [Roseiarcus sp.]|nr:hypothetical protein [Roseiarcus sp.]
MAGSLGHRRLVDLVDESPPDKGMCEDLLQDGENRHLASTHGLLSGRND